MNIKRNIIFSIILLSINVFGFSQKEVYTETVITEKEIEIKSDYHLDVFNSFGNIDVSFWDEEKIHFVVTVQAIGWNKDETREFAEKIAPLFEIFDDGKSVIVKYDMSHVKCGCKPEKNKTYKKWFNKIKVKHYSIDYSIKLPKSINQLGIFNNYGTVTLPNINCNLLLHVRYGRLVSNNITITNKSRIELKNSDIDITRFRGRDLGGSYSSDLFKISGCKSVHIDTLSFVKLQSNFSNLNIGYCNKTYFTSKSDEIHLKTAKSVSGKISFSTLNIGHITSATDFKLSSSNITVSSIKPEFEKISFSGEYNEYTLSLPKNNYSLTTDLQLTEIFDTNNKVGIPTNTDNSGKIDFNKVYGKPEKGQSKINLKCMHCKVNLN